MPKLLTVEEIIKRAKLVHGNKFDYSLIEYINSYTKIAIICYEHGKFYQRPCDHIRKGYGCPVCRGYNYTTEKFIIDSLKKHNNYYDYSESIYVGKHTKLKIICPKHGLFEQTAGDHLRGRGCKICGHIKASHAFHPKDYITPSGSIWRIQGYENKALDHLFKCGFKEHEIITNEDDVPLISYYYDNKTRIYIPDIFIPRLNQIIEVKSTWTFIKEKDKNLEKRKECIKQGYKFNFLIYTKND